MRRKEIPKLPHNDSENQEAEVLPLRVATGIRGFHPALILLLFKIPAKCTGEGAGPVMFRTL